MTGDNVVSLSPLNGYAGPRRSLILAGGGMRVAYQAGVLRALSEAGLVFHHADGTSGGTINLAMLFSGLTPIEMCDRWQTLDVHDFVSPEPLPDYLNAVDMRALGDSQGIVERVFPHLGIHIHTINGAAGMAGTFNVCNFTRKINEAISHDRLTLDLLVAGISLPILMPPVAVDDSLYVDSVWIKDANIVEAVGRGAEEIWLVWCIGNSGKYRNGLFNQYVHMIELSANGKLFAEFDIVADINRRIAAGERPQGRTSPIRLHVIRPEYPLPLDPDFYFGRIDARTLIDLGYSDARRYLKSRTEEGLPYSPEVTRMRDSQPGITFREKMAGGFSLDATDPQEGSRLGQSAGQTLVMYGAITVRDVRRFVADPDHTGQLAGTIDFAPFGEGIPASGGIFNLFSPADSPQVRYMVYEMGFTHAEESYYLAGKKVVQQSHTLELWKETTTLYTQLHRGVDANGPVVGAGILTLGVGDLIALLSTMSATDADSAAEKAEALGTFARFFLGELWDVYGVHVKGL